MMGRRVAWMEFGENPQGTFENQQTNGMLPNESLYFSQQHIIIGLDRGVSCSMASMFRPPNEFSGANSWVVGPLSQFQILGRARKNSGRPFVVAFFVAGVMSGFTPAEEVVSQ